MSKNKQPNYDITEVELPIKRVTGETVEEVLTNNAYHNILPARYLKKDEDGNVVENPAELFERVGKNVALADAVYKAEDDNIDLEATPQDIKPEASSNRRQDLCEEIFGEDVLLDDNITVDVTEDNVYAFAYDTIVPKLPNDIADQVHETAEKFEEDMTNLSFMPNSPTLMNAGDDFQQLSACFVDSPDDDINNIHETAKEAAKIFQSGGGMGYAFTNLRPYGDRVGSTGGIASGPISFMRTFDQMCFPSGTEVLTADGRESIENMDEGDIVVDENGEYQEVRETMKRNIEENIVEIETSRINKKIKSTREHPFMRIRDGKREWVEAENLREGDYIRVNARKIENDLDRYDSINLSNYKSGAIMESEEQLRMAREMYGASKGTEPNGVNPVIDAESFLRLAGWYLAEGCVTYQRGIPSAVYFTLNNSEKDVANEIQSALTQLNVDSRIKEVEDRNTLHVIAENSTLAEMFKSWFGEGHKEKTVPRFIREAPVESQVTLLTSLFEGDSHHSKRGSGSQRVSLGITSKDVVDFVYEVGIRSGTQFSRYKEENEEKSDVYQVSMSVSTALNTPMSRLFDDVPSEFDARDRSKTINGYEVVEIKEKSEKSYSGNVYNLNVENTHSYIAEDLVVHNCGTIAQGGKRRGAQMGILRIDHPDIIQYIHAKDEDVSLAHELKLNDPDDFTHNSFGEALEEARELVTVDENGVKKVEPHLRNAAEGHLSNFNISVGVTNDFMEAVKNDEEYEMINPRTGETHIATEETKELYGWFDLGDEVEVGEPLSVPAREIYERITKGAWENGEPGMIFLERANNMHSFDIDEHPEHEILATNPCGEQPLEEYEACNLGHINLSTLVDKEAPDWREFESEEDNLEKQVGDFLSNAIDWSLLDRRIHNGTHFLENVVTMSDFPVDEITEKVGSNRKIGLGIMGLAQMYVQLGTRYGSEVSNEIARQLMSYINHESKRESHKIATGKSEYAERGSFDNWHKSKYSDPTEYGEWFEKLTGQNPEEWEDGYKIRNHNTTTIAPTGTTSMIGDTTGGCEPIYDVAYYKNVSGDVQGDEMLVEFDDYFLRTLEANNIDIDPVKEEAEEMMSNNNFEGVDSLETVPDAIGELFITTSDLSALEHARVQCALQDGVDSAISKTVNAPEDATPEDAQDAFMEVYDKGGKGVTYYRDGTRSKQVLTTREDNQGEDEDQEPVDVVKQKLESGELDASDLGLEQDKSEEETDVVTDNTVEPKSRPKSLVGVTKELDTRYGDLFVTINETENGEPFEVFANIGKSGGYTESFTESTARLISLCLRCGIEPETIIDQIEGIRSPRVSWDEGDQIYSVPDGIALALRRYNNEDHNVETVETDEDLTESKNNESDSSGRSVIDSGENPECPKCSSLSLYYSEGCKTCESCGWSEC